MKKQVSVRNVDPKLWQSAKMEAIKAGVNLSEWVIQAIKEKIDNYDSTAILGQIMYNLPTNRDWLDPNLEKIALLAIGKHRK